MLNKTIAATLVVEITKVAAIFIYFSSKVDLINDEKCIYDN